MEVFNFSVIQIYNINHCSLADNYLSVCKFLFSSSLSYLIISASHVGIDYTEIGSTSTQSCHQGQFLTLQKYYNIHIGDSIDIKIGKREIV